MRGSRAEISILLGYAYHLRSRTIFLHGKVCSDMAAFVSAITHQLDEPHQELTVNISTGGGDMYAGLAIYDALKSCRAFVRTVGTGHIFSMGAVILQAGDEDRRWITPNAYVMLHHGHCQTSEHVPDVVLAESQHYKKLADHVWSIVAGRMNISVRQFNRRFLVDKWFGAKEAVAAGLADRILGAAGTGSV